MGTQIYNNTIYMAPAKTGSPTGILILQATKNVTIRNNIFDMAKGLDAITNSFSCPLGPNKKAIRIGSPSNVPRTGVEQSQILPKNQAILEKALQKALQSIRN